MCGRFTLRTSTESIANLFSGLEIPEQKASYNVAPTHSVACIRAPKKEATTIQREFALLRWGLLPSWAKEKKIGARMINARCETVQEKPAYRSAFKKRRCLVLADGFFEWLSTPDGKQPMYVTMKDDRPFAMAGLWEVNKQIEDDPIQTCTVITTSANSLMADIHDRMPVILPFDRHDMWIDPAFEDYDALQELLGPYDAKQMTARAVSKSVNKVANNSPECIEPAETQGELF